MEESVTPNDMQLLSQDQQNSNQNAVPISQSSRAAKDRKKRRLASVGIQEDVLAFLKKTKEEDSVLMERMAKRQEDTNGLLSKMVDNLSQLIHLSSQPTLQGWPAAPFPGYPVGVQYAHSGAPSTSTSGSSSVSNSSSQSL
ncbi:unnamed protein product [Allacma fusca]|uniref:Uncharacterized protein n=1 Tax=Allacma fusca TaxID=39272 RepID=A0A8J2PSQ6_9HEXA|nr:unnamed protein product [Allacma fusca]